MCVFHKYALRYDLGWEKWSWDAFSILPVGFHPTLALSL